MLGTWLFEWVVSFGEVSGCTVSEREEQSFARNMIVCTGLVSFGEVSGRTVSAGRGQFCGRAVLGRNISSLVYTRPPSSNDEEAGLT